MASRGRHFHWLLACLPMLAWADECGSMPQSTELVSLLARRTELMADVAAQKADFALVFDSAQEVQTLEAAVASNEQFAPLPATSMAVFVQIMADCAKHEQEAHLQAAVDAAEAAGEVVEATEDRVLPSLDPL